MEPLAYGELRLLPWEFARLTPREFLLRAEGHQREWDQLARLFAWGAQRDYRTALTPELLLHGRPAVGER